MVILIDEYDKPIIDYIEEHEKAKEQRDMLRSFYGVLEPLDPYLRFVFLTGVSKFSRMSIFSELNNLYDLSLDQYYSTLTGLTEAELHLYFDAPLHEMATALGLPFPDFMSKLREWYNGYRWHGNNLPCLSGLPYPYTER